jgi:hypothetical protein
MYAQLIAELEALFYKLSLFVLNHRIAQIQDQTTSLPLDIKDYLAAHYMSEEYFVVFKTDMTVLMKKISD